MNRKGNQHELIDRAAEMVANIAVAYLEEQVAKRKKRLKKKSDGNHDEIIK